MTLETTENNEYNRSKYLTEEDCICNENNTKENEYSETEINKLRNKRLILSVRRLPIKKSSSNETVDFTSRNSSRNKKSRHRVHFSNENITVEIPQEPPTILQFIKNVFCYFCCFGYCFPNI